MHLIDAYRHKNKIVLWKRSNGQNLRTVIDNYRATLYVDSTPLAKRILKGLWLSYKPSSKRTPWDAKREVLKVKVEPGDFEHVIRTIEHKSKYRLRMYHADIKPELQYVWENNLQFSQEDLTILTLEVPTFAVDTRTPITTATINDISHSGSEADILKLIQEEITKKDPDVIVCTDAFKTIPYLDQRTDIHGIKIPWHRWDHTSVAYKGGRSFFRYGLVTYHHFAIRLHGRLLINDNGMIGRLPVEAILELSQLANERPQHVASRSPGAVFQLKLLHLLYQDDKLIPYKEKPPSFHLTLRDLLDGDRAGHTMDPLLGLHADVAELDFSSMFPNLMIKENISAEMLYSRQEPLKRAPGLPFTISHHHKGYVARALKQFVELRQYYKQHPTELNTKKAQGLKGLLVSANGYLRFREFKLGLAESHMCLCAYARQAILAAKQIAEDQGFTVVHGIIDSIFIQKPGLTYDQVANLRKRIEDEVNVPLEIEGLFKWIIFLPGRNDPHRPMPARYYGVFTDGTIKARGIEVRENRSPALVKDFQRKCLEIMADHTASTLHKAIPVMCSLLGDYLRKEWAPEELTIALRVGREEYKTNVPQKRIVKLLKRKGFVIKPGMRVKYIMSENGAVLASDYRDNPDRDFYYRLLIRSLRPLIEPSGMTIANNAVVHQI